MTDLVFLSWMDMTYVCVCQFKKKKKVSESDKVSGKWAVDSSGRGWYLYGSKPDNGFVPNMLKEHIVLALSYFGHQGKVNVS